MNKFLKIRPVLDLHRQEPMEGSRRLALLHRFPYEKIRQELVLSDLEETVDLGFAADPALEGTQLHTLTARGESGGLHQASTTVVE